MAKELGDRALLVTDSGLAKAGHAERALDYLTRSGLETKLFDRSIENPTDSSVRACAEFARSTEINLIVGLGGGSSMDTAKRVTSYLLMEEKWRITGAWEKQTSQCSL